MRQTISSRRFFLIAIVFASALLVFPTVSHAGSFDLSGHRVIDSFQSNISNPTLSKGFTVSLQNKEAMLGILPNITDAPFTLRVDAIDLLPGGESKVRSHEVHYGPIIEVNYDASVSEVKKDFILRIKVDRPGRYNRIWLRKWNEKTQSWDRIRNQLDALHVWAVANIKEPGIYAAFESQDVEEGVASWFRDSRPLVVAHNGYPLNSRIRVTNLDNAKSIVVTVVSRGPYSPGRVVDLSYDAFAAIASPGSGVARVGVWPVDNVLPNGQVAGESVTRQETTPPPPVTTPVTGQGVVGNINPDSSILAAAYATLDLQTGKITAAKNADKVRPLASLTKLMTAIVFLDTKTSMDKVVTYEPDDNAEGSKLYIQYGDTVRVRDLWYTMLVGSANNATKMLRKSTGLSVEQFRDRMNKKAKELGLSTLSFYEPTGLDHKNVGTASDYVRLSQYAFQRYEEIRKATTTRSYGFRTVARNEPHTIANRSRMLSSGWVVIGTKTGYIDEAGNCLVTHVRGQSTNKEIISVVLGSPSDGSRYTDMDKALLKGFASYLK